MNIKTDNQIKCKTRVADHEEVNASLEYIRINKHQDNDIGLYNTALSSDDYGLSFENEV